ncbi:polysaccharide biosynthesis/export family protein [Aurantiacibacter suaedae]|uniref:polysaccharide biosynthesis/export family protein n=1 Tax=Aurantiacibacter suaedae TaxID=2545755 RepID=UPI0010F9A4F9|nr:polysaccharide biosynthesis/export family protein [Aurantiacibacter suaedae]
MKSWLRAVALPGLVTIALLSGCATSVPPAAPNPYAVPTYALAPADQLRITVFGESALTKEYVVTSAGDISFPLLGDVPAAGKSASELSQMLTDELSNGYLNDPRINVEVLNYRPFYVLGEVGNSGEFTFKPELTVTQAIAVAGGYTYRADRSRVFIRRVGEDREFTYDLDTGRTVYIQPGDTIRVGERYF